MADIDRLAALLRRDPAFFVRFAFHVAGGEGEYKHNWHIDAMIHQLDRVARGENRRLIMTLPPRHLKSTAASIAWPALMLGHNPALRFIAVSYNSEFAEDQGRAMLKIIDHPAYRRAFPGVQLTRRRADHLETSLGGGRLSTSLGGILTGHGADYIVIDDPTKSVEAASQAIRDSDRAWLCNTLMTRLNDPERGAIILVMQRLHEGDLVGVLREQGGWYELKLPAIAPEDERIAIGGGRFYQRRKGCALHPARWSLERLEEKRREMGSENFAAQFLEEPVPAEGNLVKAEWLKYYDPATLDRTHGQIVQSWDTASKDNPFNDYSVCVTALIRGREVYLLDVYRARLQFPKLKAAAIRLACEHGAKIVLIEDQSSGSQLIQTLRSEAPQGVPDPSPRKPEGDKVARVMAVSAMIEGGRLILPREAPWLADFSSELLGFPNAKFDDQVDALSQLMNWVLRQDPYRDTPMQYAPIYGDDILNARRRG